MTEKEFKTLLENDNRKHEYRASLVTTAYANPKLIGYLIDVMTNPGLKYASLAARLVELVCKKDLELLLPYIHKFSNALYLVREDAVIRSSAKLIELVCCQLYASKNQLFIDTIKKEHLEQFTEACFDWMLANKATAIQAHAMYSLYLLGLNLDQDWIHEELVLNIDKNLSHHSIGYQNRGKKIIKAVKSHTFLKL